jgi:hypothetical protein
MPRTRALVGVLLGDRLGDVHDVEVPVVAERQAVADRQVDPDKPV